MKTLDKAEPSELLAAQTKTASWLEEIGAPPDEEVLEEIERSSARKAFSALTTKADTL